jgi:CrcB protein
LRWFLSTELDQNRAGTLTANLLGVALASFFLVLVEHHGSDELRHLLLPGFCGGLTTFSAVALLTADPLSNGFIFTSSNGFIPISGIGYLLETIVLSLLVVAVVIPIARRIFSVAP